MAQNPYVSTALSQDFNSEQQTRARGNIGAASSADLSTLESSVGSLTDRVAAAEDALNNKKDNQTELIFDVPPTKTITHLVQSKSGKITPVFTDIDFSGEHIDPATANPSMDGTAAVGASSKYAREDHVHPSDTSREAVTNKTTVVLGTSDSQYPTDKAVAEFVNSSIATNTAHYISDNGDPFTSVAALEAYDGTVTNNDYAFITGVDSDGIAYYDRYKATVSGSTVTWSLEYRLNNSSFTAAQWAAINSGITAALVSKIHEHSNKTVLDGITETNVNNWNGKMDKVSGATAGDVATLDANGNIVDSGKTLGTSVPSDAVFTDTKVTQTKDDSGTDEYPLLMAGATNPDGDATTARYDSDVKLNPSTNTISANISGNAATADLASATSSGQIPKEADLNSYNTANRNYQCNADNSSTVTNKPSGASGAFELEVIRGTGSSCVQIYYSRDNANFNYIRKCTGLNDGTWTGWVKLINSDDINKSAGDSTHPCYINGGIPCQCDGVSTYSLFGGRLNNTEWTNISGTVSPVGNTQYIVTGSSVINLKKTGGTEGDTGCIHIRVKGDGNACQSLTVQYLDVFGNTRSFELYWGNSSHFTRVNEFVVFWAESLFSLNKSINRHCTIVPVRLPDLFYWDGKQV